MQQFEEEEEEGPSQSLKDRESRAAVFILRSPAFPMTLLVTRVAVFFLGGLP